MSLLSHPAVRTSGGILLFVALVALLGPLLSPNDYITTNFDVLLSPPSFDGARFFGTDDLGRDLFVRTMLGIRVTLVVAVVASLEQTLRDCARALRVGGGCGRGHGIHAPILAWASVLSRK